MLSYKTARGVLVAGAVLAGIVSCSVSNTGLGVVLDGATDGKSGIPICYQGTIDRANWPSGAGSTSCTKRCGPDDLGLRTCSQSDLATCQSSAGCVCLAAPCTKCADCALLAIPDCYVPTNAASPRTCDPSVTNGGDCSPACGKSLCIEADGKTGCVCNAHGKYACALWGGNTWK